MKNTKPIVTVAALCDKVLREADGVLSLIRVIDTIKALPIAATLPPDSQISHEVTAVVILKSGAFVGKAVIDLVLSYPDGRRVAVVEGHEGNFNGEAHGITIVVTIAVLIRDSGLYWIDVVSNSETLTSIPLKIEPPDQMSGASIDPST